MDLMPARDEQEKEATSDRNTAIRRITDQQMVRRILGGIGAGVYRRWQEANRENPACIDPSDHPATADDLTLMFVDVTIREIEEIFSDDGVPRDSRLRRTVQLFRRLPAAAAGLAGDAMDGARAGFQSADGSHPYQSEIGTHLDPASDRLREVEIVRILDTYLETKDHDQCEKLRSSLQELSCLMALPSYAKALAESRGLTCQETKKGSSMGRNLDLGRLTAMIASDDYAHALRLTEKMIRDALLLSAERLNEKQLRPVSDDRRVTVQERAPVRAVVISRLMDSLTIADPAGRDTGWLRAIKTWARESLDATQDPDMKAALEAISAIAEPPSLPDTHQEGKMPPEQIVEKTLQTVMKLLRDQPAR